VVQAATLFQVARGRDPALLDAVIEGVNPREVAEVGLAVVYHEWDLPMEA